MTLKTHTIHYHYTATKFISKGHPQKFLALPNGFGSRPRKFIKLMKSPGATLRMAVLVFAIYIDNLINVGFTYEECLANITASIKFLQSLEIVIHPEDSVLNL